MHLLMRVVLTSIRIFEHRQEKKYYKYQNCSIYFACFPNSDFMCSGILFLDAFANHVGCIEYGLLP